jgi:hypothetical protein
LACRFGGINGFAAVSVISESAVTLESTKKRRRKKIPVLVFGVRQAMMAYDLITSLQEGLHGPLE